MVVYLIDKLSKMYFLCRFVKLESGIVETVKLHDENNNTIFFLKGLIFIISHNSVKLLIETFIEDKKLNVFIPTPAGRELALSILNSLDASLFKLLDIFILNY